MEPTTTPTPDVNNTPKPDATGAPANPDAGTGTPATEPAIRNHPQGQTPASVPPGYVPSDQFNASRDEALRLNKLVESLGYDPKTGKPVTPATTPQPTGTIPVAPTAPMTYEQAVAQIPGFSTLTNEEKALVLNPRAAYKDISDMRRMVAEMYDERETTRQIKELKGKDGYADLDAEAFKEFIYRPENLGVTNLETLAKMFKAEQTGAPAPKPTPEGAEPTTHGTKTIAPGNGIQEMTAADAQQLRTQDPKQYAKLIRGKNLRIVG